MSNVSDIFEAAAGATTVAPDQLERLNAMADEANALEDVVARLTADLDQASKALNRIKSRDMPDLMAEMGLEDFTREGRTFSLYQFVSGSLPKGEAERAAAIKWLEEHDGAGLIKTQVHLAFGKEDRETAKQLVERLKAEGHEPNEETGVHSATLQSFARERLKSGAEIDATLLGLHVGTVVKVKEKKGKR